MPELPRVLSDLRDSNISYLYYLNHWSLTTTPLTMQCNPPLQGMGISHVLSFNFSQFLYFIFTFTYYGTLLVNRIVSLLVSFWDGESQLVLVWLLIPLTLFEEE